MKRMITFLMIAFFVLSFNTPVLANDNPKEAPSLGNILEDVLWLRPIGCVRTVLGGAAFVISLPVSIPTGKAEAAKEFLITDPYNYYLKRPLGEM